LKVSEEGREREGGREGGREEEGGRKREEREIEREKVREEWRERKQDTDTEKPGNHDRTSYGVALVRRID